MRCAGNDGVGGSGAAVRGSSGSIGSMLLEISTPPVVVAQQSESGSEHGILLPLTIS